MQEQPIHCPVAMIIFNRYDNAHEVLQQIKKVQPPKLFIIADGPREHKVGEKELCDKARSIANEVDWKCEVITNFSDTNLGCKGRVSSGLTWLFEQVESAIILEDDCLPSVSFFYYCEELLEKYKDDERIMMISGNNHAFANEQTPGVVAGDSYYFTRHVHIWGWATWRRAWNAYDITMSKWPEFKKMKYLNSFFQKPALNFFWENHFEIYYKKRVGAWSGIWNFAVWSQSGLSIAPSVNLTENTGVAPNATHTTGYDIYLSLKKNELSFPLQHPKFVAENRLLDNREMKIRFKELKRLPYPFAKWASKLKWFIKDLKK